MSLSADRKSPGALALCLMVLLAMLWGAQQVTIKVAAADVSLVAQAGIRSAVATLLLFVWARVRGIPLLRRDGTLANGVIAGVLFSAEFALIYAGLAYTAASRMVVFLYLSPCLTALGLSLLVPGERLNSRQWVGVWLAFAGVAAAFWEGFSSSRNTTWIGDLCGLMAASLWAATTVLIRATNLGRTSATKVLFYQLVVSALTLPAVSWLLGEPGVVRMTASTAAILAYQGVVVAFASYLVWFWLLTKYLAARLSVFSFLTPLFGMLFGVAFLEEPITETFAAAGILVAAGITLVNAPVKKLAEGTR
ncbi:MAG: DMT family transporter [Chloroflexota bacterium]